MNRALRLLTALASLSLFACESTVSGSAGEGSGGSDGGEGDDGPDCVNGCETYEPTACPTEVPGYFTSCARNRPEESYRCDYDHEACGLGALTASCIEGMWEFSVDEGCSVPCPATLPRDGKPCDAWGPVEGCVFQEEQACGSVTIDVACTEGYWTVEARNPCGTCTGLDLASCDADPACQWLVPGCSQTPLAQEGCFPLACDEAACGEGSSCQDVGVDPCWDDGCKACNEVVSVCQGDG